ncbi:hypothetical protein BJX76DRAFT_322884 [Aspergillus varians]
MIGCHISHAERTQFSATLLSGLCLYLAGLGGRSPAARNRLAARVPVRPVANHRSPEVCHSAARSPTNATVWVPITFRGRYVNMIGWLPHGVGGKPGSPTRSESLCLCDGRSPGSWQQVQ